MTPAELTREIRVVIVPELDGAAFYSVVRRLETARDLGDGEILGYHHEDLPVRPVRVPRDANAGERTYRVAGPYQGVLYADRPIYAFDLEGVLGLCGPAAT